MTPEEEEEYDQKVFIERAKMKLPESHNKVAQWLDAGYGVTNWDFRILDNIWEYSTEQNKDLLAVCRQVKDTDFTLPNSVLALERETYKVLKKYPK